MSDRAMRLVYFLAAILMGLNILFLCWYNTELKEDLAEAQNKPPIYITEYTLIEKVIEVEKPIFVEVKEEVIIYRNLYSRDWASVEEFKGWYEAQDFRILFPSGAYTVDCDDYAVRLQREALKQGYSVSQALVLRGKYYEVKVTKGRAGHAGNLVLIDNSYYYVEPHPERFSMVWLCDRD